MSLSKFDDKIYQTGYSEYFARYQYDDNVQLRKAGKTLAVLRDYFGAADSLSHLSLLDIGCSAGLMTRIYAKEFAYTIGIDIDEPAVDYANRTFAADKLSFRLADAMNTGLESDYFDVVTCSHIYEHVPEAPKLLDEIYRVLKRRGVCYFVAQNRLTLIEPHYFLPFLSMMPKALANVYFKLAGKGDHYYENLLTLGQLRKLTSKFELIDYTRKVIADPRGFCAAELVKPGSLKQKLALKILDFAYFMCPTYIWLLRKNV